MPIKRNYRYYILLFSFLLLLSFMQQLCLGQDRAKITVYKGNNVPFIFNTLSKYQDPLGIILTNWTRIKIFVEDTRPLANGWELWVSMNDLTGDDANTLLSTFVEIKIESVTPGFTGTYEAGWVLLTNGGTRIMYETPIAPVGVEWELWISYRCGLGGTMWNKPWDTYVENINFFLTSLP